MVQEKNQDKDKENPLQQKIEELTKQLSEAQTAAAAKEAKTEREAKEKAELERQAKLEADSDLESLLKSVGVEDEMPEQKKTDVESLTNRQMLDSIALATDTALTARLEAQKAEMSKQLAKQTEVIEGLQKVLIGFVAKSQLAEVKSEHPDFNQFGPAIQAVLKEHPTLSIKQAYVLAKGLTATDVPPVHIAETERPGIPMGPMSFAEAAVAKNRGKGSQEETSVDMGPMGASGSRVAKMRSIISAAVDKTLAANPQVR